MVGGRLQIEILRYCRERWKIKKRRHHALFDAPAAHPGHRANSWNKDVMKALLLAAAAVVLLGCGSDKSVTVGDPGEKGVIRHDIDQAKDVAHGASEQIKQGDKDAYGG